MADLFNTDDMLDTYLYENRQLLDQLQELVLSKKDEERFDQMTIHKIFRTMHTIKGSSGVMMFDTITEVAHKLEDVFAVIRESQPEDVPHLQLVEQVLEVSDFISAELLKVETGASVDGDAKALVEKLDELLELVKSKAGQVREAYTTNVATQQFYIAPVASSPAKDSDEVKQHDSVSIDEGPGIFIDLDSSVEEIEARVARTQRQIMEDAKTMVLAPGDFVIPSRESQDVRRTGQGRFIHVDIEKVNHLMELMRELVDSQSAVLNSPDLDVPGLSLDNFHEAAEEMVKLSTDIQNVIVSIRRVPLTNTFQKMNRIVFDVSRKLGKDIELVMKGEDTEVDKNIVEQISDPIMHLVRNSVDHGIEMPEEREAAGKPKRGQITLSAKQDTDYVWIVVEDNGKGLDRNEIMEKARTKGLLDTNRPETDYSDKEVYQFITLPGFSTKQNVTEYSGRGVGMDVVLSNIASIGGSLEIESEKGKGSRMTLKIPLSSFLEAENGQI